MNDQLMSLTKIFSERLFRIPDYQRGYAWGIKEVTDFWNDLCRLNSDKNHYVGVLTLKPVTNSTYDSWIDDVWLIRSKKYVPFYIVDGQQRLTTSILLLVAIAEMMDTKKIKALNFTTKEEIVKKFLFESKDENKSRTYVFSYETDNPSYDYLITQVFKQKSELCSAFQETTYTANLDMAKDFFSQKLQKLSVEEIELVFSKITQHFLFNTYEIDSDIDVFVTFETMNNRGKPLSHLELLKNRLIYISTLFDIEEDVKDRLRRNINACWKDIYHYLGRNKIRQLPDDEFLNAHFELYFCNEISKDQETERIRYRTMRMGMFQHNYLLDKVFIPENIPTGKLKVNDIFNYTESLKNDIKLWNYINNPEFSDFNSDIKEYLTKIGFLINGSVRYTESSISVHNVKILLLACFEKISGEVTVLKLLKSIERYLFIHNFYIYDCFVSIGKVFVDFNDIVIKLKNNDIKAKDVIERLDKNVTSIVSSTEINQKLVSVYNRSGFYHTNFLFYFLCEYELYLMKQSKTMIPKLNREVLYENGYDSVEHIYPQNPHHKYWIDTFCAYNSKQKKCLRNSLGNFVALSKAKNSKLGNRSFPEKKCNGQNTVGYKFGTYAEIELSNYDNWGAEEILSRGVKMVSFLEQRWGIKIGTEKKSDKKEFLGLAFLK